MLMLSMLESRPLIEMGCVGKMPHRCPHDICFSFADGLDVRPRCRTLPQAIRLYQNCLKKFHGGRDPTLHMYLAHAYFDARQYDECMSVLLKALHISPNNLQLWYNLALTRETFAVAVLQKEQKGEARTLAEVENAIEDLKVPTILGNGRGTCRSRGRVRKAARLVLLSLTKS